MLGPQRPRAEYVSQSNRARNGPTNEAAKQANSIMRSQRAMVDAQLGADFDIVKRESVYLPNFLAASNDFKIMNQLTADLEHEQHGMINWSQHLKHENPEFSATFLRIITQMQEYFDADVFASRLNFYRDGTDWKPFHHDSHAYGAKGVKEDFTMGASFGASRELQFLHEPSGQTFSFPQNNGDIFAFTSSVNQRFKHGVPKAASSAAGPRFSIIAWGKRRTINARNGGGPSGVVREMSPLASAPVYDTERHSAAATTSDDRQTERVSMSAVTAMVQKMQVSDGTQEGNKPTGQARVRTIGASSRVQGGWNRGRGRGAPSAATVQRDRPNPHNQAKHSKPTGPAPEPPSYDDE